MTGEATTVINPDPDHSHPDPIGQPLRHRVLVVDDNTDLARLTSYYLTRHGYQVATARSGPEAIEAARFFLPRVVLLDIGLPGMDGFQVAEVMREMAETKDATIIAISAHDPQSNPNRSLRARFDHQLVKPVDFKDLLALLAPTDSLM